MQNRVMTEKRVKKREEENRMGTVKRKEELEVSFKEVVY